MDDEAAWQGAARATSLSRIETHMSAPLLGFRSLRRRIDGALPAAARKEVSMSDATYRLTLTSGLARGVRAGLLVFLVALAASFAFGVSRAGAVVVVPTNFPL